MSYAGLDLSRQRLDVHVVDEDGSTVDVTAVHPDADALRTLTTVVARDERLERSATVLKPSHESSPAGPLRLPGRPPAGSGVELLYSP